MKKYENKLKFRIAASCVLLALGICALYLGAVLLEEGGRAEDFLRGFYVGTGGGLSAASIITIIKNVLLLKNEEKKKKAELKENDERNLFIYGKTAVVSAYIILYGMYAALMIIGVVVGNIYVFLTLLCVLFVMLLVIFGVWLIMKRIY